ncbi:hypothetical protein [Cellulomonas sp. Root137]|uniref:hypothetical protein n=1 Tax=Cellulomonas sp. Root137 TaxID=1736459 RepID=UPI000AD9A9B8|nr:hypothetical protein [Cellulomonas sp. Root137]
MHPELFAVLYDERERELEAELHRRFVLAERAPRPARSWRLPRLTLRAAPTACCVPA